MDNNLKKRVIAKYFVVSIIVAVGGMFFSDICGDLFNGMTYGQGANVGIGIYLCIVIVACTGIIISHIDKKQSQGERSSKDPNILCRNASQIEQ